METKEKQMNNLKIGIKIAKENMKEAKESYNASKWTKEFLEKQLKELENEKGSI